MNLQTLYFSGRPVIKAPGLDIDMIAEATTTLHSSGRTIRSWMVGWRAYKALERAADAGSPLMEWKEKPAPCPPIPASPTEPRP